MERHVGTAPLLRVIAATCAALAILSACTQFPELDAVTEDTTRGADFLPFLPLDDLLAQTSAQPREDVPAIVASRVAALRARADRLRGPVLTSADRARLSGIR